jgi:hypothetical protein
MLYFSALIDLTVVSRCHVVVCVCVLALIYIYMYLYICIYE